MKNKNRAVLLALSLLAGATCAQAKIGLSSQFINVVLENLKPGRTYNLRELKGVPYTVRNRGTDPAEVAVESLIPNKTDVRPPYEPVPDVNWLQLNPGRFTLGPGEPGFSDVIISIPDDPKLVGRHFHAQIWGHTVGTTLLQAGVKSDVRFSIGKGPDTLAEEERRASMVDLNYDLWPASLSINKAKAGQAYDAKKEEKRSFKLTNRSEKELELVFSAMPWQTTLSPLPGDYETMGDLSWVRFEPAKLKVAGESLQELRLIFDAPASFKGKKLAFIVQISLPVGTVVGATHRVFVTFE